MIKMESTEILDGLYSKFIEIKDKKINELISAFVFDFEKFVYNDYRELEHSEKLFEETEGVMMDNFPLVYAEMMELRKNLQERISFLGVDEEILEEQGTENFSDAMDSLEFNLMADDSYFIAVELAYLFNFLKEKKQMPDEYRKNSVLREFAERIQKERQ